MFIFFAQVHNRRVSDTSKIDVHAVFACVQGQLRGIRYVRMRLASAQATTFCSALRPITSSTISCTMRQTYIDRHFTSDRRIIKQSPSFRFLDLPVSLRRRVYAHTDLAGLQINLNFVGYKIHKVGGEPLRCFCYSSTCSHYSYPIRVGLDPCTNADVWTCDPGYAGDELYSTQFEGQNYLGLLFSCKQIHDEVERLIYQENDFIICQGDPNGFQRLLDMDERHLGMLRSLTIRRDERQVHINEHSWTKDGLGSTEPCPRRSNLQYELADVSYRSGQPSFRSLLARLIPVL